MATKISFVIPTINSTTLVETCLQSLVAKNIGDYEIIVVDDGSPANIITELEIICSRYKAKLITSVVNGGFSKTVNKGILASTGDIVVLTNNDIVFTHDVIAELIKSFSSHPKVGVVGGLLLYPAGTIQHGGILLIGRDAFTHRGWHYNPTNMSEVKKTEYMIGVTGALFAIRRETFVDIGLLHEEFFISCEDTEYCLRAWKRGWRVLYNGSMQAIHAEGATRGNTPSSKNIKGPQWVEKERQSSMLFRKMLSDYGTDHIKELVGFSNNEMNSVKLKDLSHNIGSAGVIGVHRAGALGDVLMTTGVVHQLKKQFPNHDIVFSTSCPDVLTGNPDITRIVPSKNHIVANVVFDLDLAYERSPNLHAAHAYSQVVFGTHLPLHDLRPVMTSHFEHRQSIIAKLPPKFLTDRGFVVINMSVSWTNRTWPRQRWIQVINHLIDVGYSVAVVGKGADFAPDTRPGIANLLNKASIQEIRELIKASKLYIGPDSGVLHIALTTDTPVIGLFTVANPEYRMFPRGDAVDRKSCAITPRIGCRFCLHRESPPVTYVGCVNKTLQCLNDITPKEVIETALKILT